MSYAQLWPVRFSTIYYGFECKGGTEVGTVESVSLGRRIGMAEIVDDEKELFGFNEKDLLRRLKKALNDLQQKEQEERDKHSGTDEGPDIVWVRDNGEGEGVEAGRLHIRAELDGRLTYTIAMKIVIS